MLMIRQPIVDIYQFSKNIEITTKNYAELFRISLRGARKNIKRMVKLSLLEHKKISRKHVYIITKKGYNFLKVINYINKLGD